MLSKGFKGREKRGGERVGSRRRSPCTSSRGFRPNFDVFFYACVNESEFFQKKVSRVFGFLIFLPYICTVDETKRGVLKVQNFLMFHF